MRVLFLDDDLSRHVLFDKNSQGHEVDHAGTIEELKELLKASKQYDIISLDHDLGGEQMVDCAARAEIGLKTECGCDAVEALGIIRPPLPYVIVHSYNAKAALKMVRALRSGPFLAEYRPFGSWFPNGVSLTIGA